MRVQVKLLLPKSSFVQQSGMPLPFDVLLERRVAQRVRPVRRRRKARTGHLRLRRAAEHLLHRLDDDVVRCLSLQPVEEGIEVAGGDVVDVAGVADVVEDDRHPAAAVLARRSDGVLHRSQRRRVGADVDLVGIGRRNRPGRIRLREDVSGAGGVVAAVLHHCLHRRAEVAERKGEVGDVVAALQQVVAVVADLTLRLGRVDGRQVGVVCGVATDLVAGRREVGDVAPGHVGGVAADSGAVHEVGGVHVVRVQHRQPLVLVGPAVIEGERDDRLALCCRCARRPELHRQREDG